MPATPPGRRKACRAVCREPLSSGAQSRWDAAQADYLGNVMRLKEGDRLLIFDGMSGEWLAEIAEAARSG
jgi:16S rRNA (uracil1498-N3)-methyltransferase